MDPVLRLLCLLLTILPICNSSPLATPFRSGSNSKFCKLPGPILSRTGPGEYKPLEDCSNITKFGNLPVPAPSKDLGVHPSVCCPRDNSEYVCFETDPWCPSYLGASEQIDEATVSDNNCTNRSGGEGSAQCVNFKDCEGILNQGVDSVAHVDVCGWDKGDKALKVCCPTGSAQGRKNYTPHPRYSRDPEEPYPCDDKADYGNDYETGMCEIWKFNGGCDMSYHFHLDSEEDTVSSWEMFHFMMMSCMKTCGRCAPAGDVPNVCQDEHPKCRSWAKNNMCLINPRFMGHTCRESCGVCGFLSPFDETVQNIQGNIYTYKQNAFTEEGHTCPVGERKNFPFGEIKHCFDCGRQNIRAESLPLCEATIISDKWAVTGRDCYSTYPHIQNIDTISNQTIRIRRQKSYLGVPSEETLEVKKVYNHPIDHTISVALLELGRRIPYDFEKYGDTPACLDQWLSNNSWIKCIMEKSYKFKNNHDLVQEECKNN